MTYLRPLRRLCLVPVTDDLLTSPSQVVFGTGDELGVVTLTANSAFVSAARNQVS